MINKRLIRLCGSGKKYIRQTVGIKWVSLLCGIGILWLAGSLIDMAVEGTYPNVALIAPLVLGLAAIRFVCEMAAPRVAHKASAQARTTLRRLVYQKLCALGAGYSRHIPTAAMLQTAGEGIESLDNYFARFLPQFFYAMLAPISLFAALSSISVKVSLILLACVPLIPLSIVAFTRIAKKLMKQYWHVYTDLGGTFLENLHGLTTLKLFGADEKKHKEMNAQSESFRRMTMKVLSMQLHSITLMDILAYGGAAAGCIAGVFEYQSGSISMGELIILVLLSAEFFLPLRLLGSFFHVATTSLSAADKLFKLLDIPEEKDGEIVIQSVENISFKKLSFCYDSRRSVLKDINLDIQNNDFVAIVGESGSGKSTLGALLVKQFMPVKGCLYINGMDIRNIQSACLRQKIGLLSTNSYIFNGTVRDNLLTARPYATAREMDSALQAAQLLTYVQGLGDGLDTQVGEDGALLSGGQRQRLALARMLLADKPVMIFDEATSNIDCESEEIIWESIGALKGKKTVIVISHRLASMKEADRICVLDKGKIAQSGTHDDLMACSGAYSRMWAMQQELESIRGEAS